MDRPNTVASILARFLARGAAGRKGAKLFLIFQSQGKIRRSFLFYELFIYFRDGSRLTRRIRTVRIFQDPMSRKTGAAAARPKRETHAIRVCFRAFSQRKPAPHLMRGGPPGSRLKKTTSENKKLAPPFPISIGTGLQHRHCPRFDRCHLRRRSNRSAETGQPGGGTLMCSKESGRKRVSAFPNPGWQTGPLRS